jgi:hypothetical protein
MPGENLGRNLNPQEVAEYNEAYRKGCDLLNRHIGTFGQWGRPPQTRQVHE